jgi:hypothetical protein
MGNRFHFSPMPYHHALATFAAGTFTVHRSANVEAGRLRARPAAGRYDRNSPSPGRVRRIDPEQPLPTAGIPRRLCSSPAAVAPAALAGCSSRSHGECGRPSRNRRSAPGDGTRGKGRCGTCPSVNGEPQSVYPVLQCRTIKIVQSQPMRHTHHAAGPIETAELQRRQVWL